MSDGVKVLVVWFLGLIATGIIVASALANAEGRAFDPVLTAILGTVVGYLAGYLTPPGGRGDGHRHGRDNCPKE